MAEKEKPRGTGQEDLTLSRTASAEAEKPVTIQVRLAQLGEEVMDIIGPKGMTVSQALEKAGKKLSSGLELRVNNSTCNLDRVLEDGEIIMLVPRIVGGQVEEMTIAIQNSEGKVVDAMFFALKI